MGKASEMDIKTQALWPIFIFLMLFQGEHKCIIVCVCFVAHACSKTRFECEDAWVFRSCAHFSASSVSSGHINKALGLFDDFLIKSCGIMKHNVAYK